MAVLGSQMALPIQPSCDGDINFDIDQIRLRTIQIVRNIFHNIVMNTEVANFHRNIVRYLDLVI